MREKGTDSSGITLEALLKYLGALWQKNLNLIPAVLEAFRMLIFDKRAAV